MYVPSKFREESREQLAALIRRYPFGTLVTIRDGLPFASHIPFLYEECAGGSVLIGHLARANPQWEDLAAGQTALVMFQGPHAYVSPSWYESPGVPTWNYAVAHVYGKSRLIEEHSALRRLIERMTAVHESGSSAPWKPDLRGERGKELLDMIVGFEIDAETITGKFKLGQNRSDVDRANVIRQLGDSHDASSRNLAELMETRNIE